ARAVPPANPNSTETSYQTASSTPDLIKIPRMNSLHPCAEEKHAGTLRSRECSVICMGPPGSQHRAPYLGTPCFHLSQWATTFLMKGAEAAHRLLTAGTKPPESPSGPHPHNECHAVSPG